MSSDVEFDDSVNTLKKTIPLMMKYNVPVLPQNYALWYTYASQANPKLNQEIDSVLASHPTLSNFHVESLSDKHLKSQVQELALETQKNVEDLVNSLNDSIGFTRQDAEKFEQAMDFCHDELSGINNGTVQTDQIADYVGELISKSLQMRDNAKDFGESLNKAQAEIRSLREKLQNSRNEALKDELTGLLNRRAFNDELNKLLADELSGSCLVIADIDHFKHFNDTHGHLLGDEVLKVVAKRLSKYDNRHISSYRFGGEEFALLISTGGIASASRLADKLRLSIEAISIRDKKSGKKMAKITCSFGVAKFSKELDSFALIDLADSRLYQAKENGRNQVVYA